LAPKYAPGQILLCDLPQVEKGTLITM